MLQRLLSPDDYDICPNCGTSCLARDILCPVCGKNLDELYEQLPPGWTGIGPFFNIPPEFGLCARWTVANTAVFAVSIWLGPNGDGQLILCCREACSKCILICMVWSESL